MTKSKVKIIPRGGIAFVTHGHLHKAALAAKQQLKKRGVKNIKVQKLNVIRFPSGEVKPQIAENVRGKDIFFFFGFSTGNFNDELITLVIAMNTLDKADCGRVTLVLPFFPYTRQDQKDDSRTPLSASVIIRMLELSSSFDRVITVDLHAGQLESVFSSRIKFDHLHGGVVMAPAIKKYLKGEIKDLVVIAPDNGSAKRAKKLAHDIGSNVPIAIFDKERTQRRSKTGAMIGAEIDNKICFINDDMIDTSGTIADAASILKQEGAKEVIISSTHAILSTKDGMRAYEKLATAGVNVIVTDSLATEPRDWLTVLPIGSLMGDVIYENITPNGSVSKIIQGIRS